MAVLSKQGIITGSTIKTSHITDLYDALLGDSEFSNLNIHTKADIEQLLRNYVVKSDAKDELVLSDTYVTDDSNWIINKGDTYEQAFGKIAYALERLLLDINNGIIKVFIRDNGNPTNGTVVITNESNEEVMRQETTNGSFSASLPFGKYTVSLIASEYDILNTTTIVDNETVDNQLIGNRCENVDVAGFDTVITFNVRPVVVSSIDSFVINENAENSSNKNLRLSFITSGIVDDILISNNPDFIGATWQQYTSSNIDYVFDYVTPITLTLYAKVRNSLGESEVVSDSIQMINGITRSDIGLTYNSLLDCLHDIKDQYTNGLTQDVTINVTSEVLNVASPKFFLELSEFNQDTDFYLRIYGNNNLTIDCSTNGGFRLDSCDNVIFEGIDFINVGNMQERTYPEQLSGLFINKCKNICVKDCSFDGRYPKDTSKIGRYAIVVKDTNIFTLTNTTVKYFSLTPVDVRHTEVFTMLGVSISNCPIVRGLISQPALVELKHIKMFIVEDSIIDGTDMDTMISGHNIVRTFIRRSELINCPGEVLAYTNTSKVEEITFENCLIENNLYDPYYYWTKQYIAISNVEKLNFINNTIRLNAIRDTEYYSRLVKCTARLGELNMYNNVFDFYLPNLENNYGESALFEFPILESINSDYNLYRDKSDDLNTITNNMIVILDNESPVYINRINSLTELQSLNCDNNSSVINVDTSLFVGNDLKVLEPAIIGLSIDVTKAPKYDINKKLPNPNPNLGCVYDNGLDGTNTTVIEYTAINTLNNDLFSEEDTGYMTNSRVPLLFQVDKYDDKELYKWVFTDGNDNKTIKFGNNIIIELLSQLDSGNIYTGNATYTIEIITL